MFSSNKKQISAEDAYLRATALCSRAEHSRAEIRDKLFKWGLPKNDAEIILAKLVEHRYVDDERFATAYVYDKLNFSGWGRRKIEQGLYQKGVTAEFLNSALDAIDPQLYTEIALKVLTAKAKTLPRPLTFETRTKLYRFMLSRGFESTLIASLIRQHFSSSTFN